MTCDGENIFLNLSIIGENPTINTIARFNKSYNEALLHRQSDYQMSVIKFSIPLQALPLWVFDSQAHYKIGVAPFSNGGASGGGATTIGTMTELVYQTSSATATPTHPEYYYVYAYGRIAEFLSTALEASFITAGSPGGVSPYCHFNIATKKFEFVIPDSFTTSGGGTGWCIIWSKSVQDMLISFDVWVANDPLFPEGRYELINRSLISDPATSLPAPPYAAATSVLSQEYSSLDYVNSVRKLVLTSTGIANRNEWFPSQSGNVAAGQSIISDFQLDLAQEAGNQRTVALYSNNHEPIFTDLISSEPLRNIDLSIFWLDKTNTARPLYLSYKDTVNLKLYFRKC